MGRFDGIGACFNFRLLSTIPSYVPDVMVRPLCPLSFIFLICLFYRTKCLYKICKLRFVIIKWYSVEGIQWINSVIGIIIKVTEILLRQRIEIEYWMCGVWTPVQSGEVGVTSCASGWRGKWWMLLMLWHEDWPWRSASWSCQTDEVVVLSEAWIRVSFDTRICLVHNYT